MKIMDILVRESVVVELESTTKDGVLAELTDAVSKARPGLDRDRLLTVLQEREALQSTGIENGLKASETDGFTNMLYEPPVDSKTWMSSLSFSASSLSEEIRK